MTEAPARRQPIKSWARRATLAVATLLISISGTLVLGAYVPSLPHLGIYASLALSLWPAWVLVAALMGGLLAWRSGRGPFRRALVMAAGVAAIGSLIVVIRLLSLAWSNDVRIGPGAPFGFTGLFTQSPPDESLAYTREFGEDLKVHVWRPNTPAPNAGWPIVLYVHGGGWNSGTAEGRGADLRWFADQGWLALAIDYSLSNEERHLWNRVHDQIGCALTWTEDNVAILGGDVHRLALLGESAGGNLVLNVANLANAGKLGSSCGGTVPKIHAVGAIYPAVDIAAVSRNPYIPTGDAVRVMAQQYTGGLPDTVPERYVATNSANHLSPTSPPTLLFISENDHLVPVESMRAYAAASLRAGVRTRVISIPYGEHGFDMTGLGNAIVRQVTLQFFRRNLSWGAPTDYPP